MSTLSRSRHRAAANPEPILAEATLTIPDALIAWAQDSARQLAWAHPYGQEVAALIAQAAEAPLPPEGTSRLLNRLEAVASAAIAEGRGDLLLGLDLQTAERLGLHIRVETPRGPLHIGPDPRSRLFEGMREPAWTFSEVRLVVEAAATEAVDLAWKAKQMLMEVFPGARIDSLEHDRIEAPCSACGGPARSVMLSTDGGFSYHYHCWSEMTAPMPEHLVKLLRKAPRAKAT